MTVQVAPWFITTGVVQVTVVAVVRRFTTTFVVPLLEEWEESTGYEAVTAAVPEVEAVKVEVHVADAVVPAKEQFVNESVTPVWDSPTVPVGVRKVPAADVSVTVTVQVEAWLMNTGVSQLTLVLVVLGLTTMLVVPMLEACVLSLG